MVSKLYKQFEFWIFLAIAICIVYFGLTKIVYGAVVGQDNSITWHIICSGGSGCPASGGYNTFPGGAIPDATTTVNHAGGIFQLTGITIGTSTDNSSNNHNGSPIIYAFVYDSNGDVIASSTNGCYLEGNCGGFTWSFTTTTIPADFQLAFRYPPIQGDRCGYDANPNCVQSGADVVFEGITFYGTEAPPEFNWYWNGTTFVITTSTPGLVVNTTSTTYWLSQIWDATSSAFSVDCSGYSGSIFSSSTLGAIGCYAQKIPMGIMGMLISPLPMATNYIYDSYTKIQTVFPFSLVFNLKNEVASELQSANVDASSTLSVPIFGHGDYQVLSPTLLEDLVGKDAKDQMFTIIKNIIWLATGVTLFLLI